MSTKDIIDVILRALEILTGWPIILLIVLMVFRREVSILLPEISKRLKKAEIGGNKFEFSEIQRAVVEALPEVIERGAQEYKDQPEQLAGFVREQVKKLPNFQEATSPKNKINLVGRSILWVDDTPLDNIYESSILKRLGASIIFARSTEEAIEFFRRDKFDLIISDVNRNENRRSNPNAGYELLETLEKAGREYRLIFYTSNVAYVNKDRAASVYGVADTPSKIIELAIHALK